MANKWADYLISKVKYDDNHNYITNLFIHKDNGDKVGPGSTYTRKSVIESILNGTSFKTIYLEDGNYKNGSKVDIVIIEGISYLRTDSNKIKKDNLGELPEF